MTKHPFRRGVVPGEPFNLHDYTVAILNANARRERDMAAKRQKSASLAERVLDAYYSGKPVPDYMPATRMSTANTRHRQTEVLELLNQQGPLTAGQLRKITGDRHVGLKLHSLRKMGKVRTEGKDRAHDLLWHANHV